MTDQKKSWSSYLRIHARLIRSEHYSVNECKPDLPLIFVEEKWRPNNENKVERRT